MTTNDKIKAVVHEHSNQLAMHLTPSNEAMEAVRWSRQDLQHRLEALVREERSRTIKEIDDSRDHDSCECDNCHRWRRYYKANYSPITNAN